MGQQVSSKLRVACMSLTWFTKEMGVESGPFNSATLKTQASDGTITPDTLVRRGLYGEWVLAHRIHGLFDLPTGLVRAEPALLRAKPLPDEPAAVVTAAEVETVRDFPAITPEPVAAPSAPARAVDVLTECSDCSQQISRRARECPHCGCPRDEETLVKALPQLTSARLKPSIGGMVLSAIGILGTLFFAFGFDTTVPTGGGEVHNLGLVATQLIGVLISLALTLIGAMPSSVTFKFESKT
jgi:hypothetical protein